MISLEDYKKQAQSSKVLTNYTELLADIDTPVGIYSKLRQDSEDAFLFESILGGEQVGRYSFIGFKALDKLVLESKPGLDSYQSLQQHIDELSGDAEDLLPFFHKGFVGFFSFESIAGFEPSIEMKTSDQVEAYMLLVGSLVVLDHVKQKLYLIDNLKLADDVEALYAQSFKNLEALSALVQSSLQLPRLDLSADKPSADFKSNTGEEEFKSMVTKAKEHIYEGDIFQVVLSHKFYKEISVDPLNVYRMLRTINPSPYLFLYKSKDFTLVGSSPEMLVKSSLEKGSVQAEIRPIAGTYKRGETEAEDDALAEKLTKDTKELAEHTMLIDLARNDLGRVCQPGSISVPENMIVEKYSHVLHIVSSVVGTVLDSISATELLKASFPAGTLSGAPKIEAIKIISQLEKEARGPYGGAIGYFGLDGLIDTAILIRTLVVEQDRVTVQAGAGIVADSDPDKEWQETINKASVLLENVMSS